MIFVTVGTHEQQFDRLVKCIDDLKGKGLIRQEVFMQIGFSTYEPKYCKWSRLIPYNKLIDYVKDASIVICHGGPATFIIPLQFGKTPIVVPRQSKFEEHVNDHQVDFVEVVSKQFNNIIPVFDIDDLKNIITDFKQKESTKSIEVSNNKKFCSDFERIILNKLGD